jgi:hypothetical protein
MKRQPEELLHALNASPTALRLDSCGDWAIIGKLGQIVVDGHGYLLCVTTGESARRWFNLKQRLSFCRVMQDGDDEGCLHLDHLPNLTEARAIREAVGIRKRRQVSATAMAQAISTLEQNRATLNRPLAG